MLKIKCRQDGFTLIELLVVIAIIAILIGLLLPAVQKVREASARMKCQSNMKQIGIALQTYHDSKGRLPPGTARVTTQENVSPATFWSYFLLPYLEQQAVYNAAPLVQQPVWTTGTYLAAAQVNLPVYRCASTSDKLTYASQGIPNRVAISYAAVQTGEVGNPASPNGPGEWSAHLDDAAWAGNGFDIRPLSNLYRFTGPLGYNTITRITDITDGTSNTVAIGERYRVMDTPVDGYTDSAGPGAHGTWGIGTPNINNAAQQSVGSIGFPLNFNQNGALTDGTNISKTAGSFNSRHGTGVNFLFCDGHVSFLSNSTADLTRLALGSFAGGETVKVTW